VLDLYAGAGLFSVAAAARCQASVTAVEGDRIAAEDLRANALPYGDRLRAVKADVESFVDGDRTGGLRSAATAEVTIVDPPRTGLSLEAVTGVVAVASPRVVYVSCDIATLARDSRRLVDAGYSLERLDGFDMFPNTPHVEMVAVFGRGSLG
jgi:23S rRNA (uracil1939-C5)-methyltransferase